MTECTTQSKLFQADLFPTLKRRKIRVDFNGGSVSSDAGLLLLKQVDRYMGLVSRIASIVEQYDPRQSGKIRHDVRSMLVQRIYGMACGYEDLNDHNELRHDISWQTATDRVNNLASAPTLCRFENLANREMSMRLMRLMIDIFIDSFEKAPEELILDFDNTDVALHGNQEGKFFHGYYDEYCFLPLYVFCGDKLVTVLLQPSDKDGSKHAGVLLKIICGRLRAKWPEVRIIYRGDSGFARKRHLYWCEQNNIDYIIGLITNSALKSEIVELLCDAEHEYVKTGESCKLYGSFIYSAGSWKGRKRRVIGKAEFNRYGANPRFVLTTLDKDPREIYEDGYCPRGDMENRLKEQKLDLFSDRMSAHEWWTNQFRILLAGFAYILIEKIRSGALKGTKLAKAQTCTIRLKLLKIGAVIKRNTRSIYFSLSSSCPYQDLFWRVAEIFAPG